MATRAFSRPEHQTHTCDVDEGRLRGSVAAVGSALRAAVGATAAGEGEHARGRRRAGTTGWAWRLSTWHGGDNSISA